MQNKTNCTLLRRKFLIIGLPLIIGMCFLHSCKRKNSCDDIGSHPFTPFSERDTSWIPYKGHDSLYFEVSDSIKVIDTLLFIGQGRNLVEIVGPQQFAGECVYQMYGDALWIRFATPSGSDTIIFHVYKSLDGAYNSSNNASYIEVIHKGLKFRWLGNDIYGDRGYYKKVIYLNSREYFNVVISNIIPDTSYTIINKDLGIVRLSLNPKHILTLLK